MANSASQVSSNVKALSLSKAGNVGAARYYGNISSLSEEWEKTDLGDAKTNANFETAGKVIDTTKVVADTTSFACNIAVSSMAVRDYRFKNPDKHIKRYEVSMKNFKHNVRGELGFYLTKPGFKVKNVSKMYKTINDTKDTVKYFIGQKEKVEKIWVYEENNTIPTPSSSDPFEELEDSWDDYKKIKVIYDAATK